MEIKDIKNVTESIKLVDKKIEEIEAVEHQIKDLEAYITALKKRLKIYVPRLESYRAIGQNLDLKLTFNQILDEIARELKIERHNIAIVFSPVVSACIFSNTNALTKEQVIENEIKEYGRVTASFIAATNIRNLRYNHRCAVSDNEKKEWEKNDPLYHASGTYSFEIKPYAIQANGKRFIDCLETEVWREDGIRMGTSLVIGEAYGDLYYYINPKNIDLDSDDYFAKAIKSLLTDDQLKQYSKVKEELNELELKTEEEKTTIIQQISTDEEKIKELKTNLNPLEEEIKKISWPEITVRLGDFLEAIYKSADNELSQENTRVRVCEPTLEKDVRYYIESPFRLIIDTDYKTPILHILWTMSYSDKMYDGLTLFEHFYKNNITKSTNSFFQDEYKNCWKGLPKIENFCFTFDPKFFFRRTYPKKWMQSSYFLDEEELSIETIRKAVLYSMYKEIRRETASQTPAKVKRITYDRTKH